MGETLTSNRRCYKNFVLMLVVGMSGSKVVYQLVKKFLYNDYSAVETFLSRRGRRCLGGG